MLADTIQAELVRLQLHPVNLNVSAKADRFVTLQGSLLQYWNLPPCLDSQWLLAQLRRLPDAAGPEAVMSALAAAYRSENRTTKASKSRTQLRLLDAQTPATHPAALNQDS